jgi:outer membrane protein OmpA-like peptidoglycan-associated protein
MSLRKTLLAATIMALPLAAQAQPVTGIYVGGGLGANWHNNVSMDFPANDITVPFGARFTTSTGYVALISAGWGFGNGLRVELEGNLRNNDVNRINNVNAFATTNMVGFSGAIRTYGIMANALYDIGATRGWPVHITLGAGAGYAWHQFNGVRYNFGGSERYFWSDTSGAFAYQGIAGLSIPIRAVPGLAITAEYRYFATLSTRIHGTGTFGNGQIRSYSDSVSNDNQSALVGVRYNFGHAPRAVAVAQQPAAARSFIVFFDFDRADLTARGREIVGQAAQAARTGTTRIEVAGHADRSGSDAYNQALSQRRANTVAAELVRLGVARNAISVAAFGESRPLVPTADGVREPQNRRVEIVLR